MGRVGVISDVVPSESAVAHPGLSQEGEEGGGGEQKFSYTYCGQ